MLSMPLVEKLTMANDCRMVSTTSLKYSHQMRYGPVSPIQALRKIQRSRKHRQLQIQNATLQNERSENELVRDDIAERRRALRDIAERAIDDRARATVLRQQHVTRTST